MKKIGFIFLAFVLSQISLHGNELETEKMMGQNILKNFPDFVVDGRKEEFENYPCLDCHEEDVKPNPKIRVLEEMHDDIELKHGGGRFWCLTCHSINNRNVLISFKSTPIDFNKSYLLCGQCHFQRQKDFFGGAHGKRKDTWNGPKKLTTCTECHNPHNPKIAPRKPVAVPKTRSGLNPMLPSGHKKQMIWKQMETH